MDRRGAIRELLHAADRRTVCSTAQVLKFR
jgi:hypothetical protein